MRTKLFILAVLSFTFLTNCNSDDTNSTTNPLSGLWNLTHISGGIAGFDQSYEIGDITWSFNTETQMVTIVNNVINNFTVLQSGTYTYSVLTTDDQEASLIINDMNLGILEFSENTVTIDQKVADGITIKLTR
ncbi:MAG: hypothetical protein R2812_01185 [Gelidibacter sp.]|nr:hypothetical protein [Gelidibacter sp.]